MLLISAALLAWPSCADPTAATPFEALDWALSLGQLTADDVFVDLGCGDGRALVLASADYGCTSFGFDVDPQAVIVAERNIERNGVDPLAVAICWDVRRANWRKPTVVYCYLPLKLLAEIRPKLARLAPGSRVISYMHGIDLPGGERHVRTIGGTKHVVFLYRIPGSMR